MAGGERNPLNRHFKFNPTDGWRLKRIPLPGKRVVVRDLYYHLTTISWPVLALAVVAAFAAINALFALAYEVDGGIANAHPGSFADAFFFSVQTMATIGYGTMAPRSTLANVLVCVEALSGLTALAVITGLVFARFSRPTARVRFSRVAVVSRRDGVPSLMFRVVNERANRIVDAQVQLVLGRRERTAEGESVRRFHDLALSRGRNPLFSLSWTVIHPITPNSPFHGETAESLRNSLGLVIVSLTGLDESFLQTVHARYAYGPEEIVWGARFADVLTEMPGGAFAIDYSRFDEIAAADAGDNQDAAGSADGNEAG